MALKTTLEQLEAVEAAIEKAELAQAYAVGSRSKTSPTLDVLYKRRDVLQARYNAEQGIGGPAFNVGIKRRH